jgi:glycosyltransferase involved in cell wall biosynthesis
LKHLLYNANPFPPIASAGNARHLRFLRYLPEFGWQATVLTVRARGPLPDPPGVAIERVDGPGLERTYALARRLLGPMRAAPTVDAQASLLQPRRQASSRRAVVESWLQLPDSQLGWAAAALWRGRRLLREGSFNAIVSSYPVGSAELLGAALARISGLPWVADYRDPWRHNEFRSYPTLCHETLNARLERWALARASAVSAVNEPIISDLRRLCDTCPQRTCVIPNGYDPAGEIDEVRLGPGLWLAHTGRIYGRGEQLAAFLDAFAQLPADVNLVLLGTTSPQLAAQAGALGIGDRVHLEPFVPHARARGLQQAADGLVLFTGLEPGTITGKVFEYLASGRPVFAVTPRNSAAWELIEEAQAGRCAAPGVALGPALADFVADLRAGRLTAARPEVVGRYDGRRLTGELAALLDEVSRAAAPRVE